LDSASIFEKLLDQKTFSPKSLKDFFDKLRDALFLSIPQTIEKSYFRLSCLLNLQTINMLFFIIGSVKTVISVKLPTNNKDLFFQYRLIKNIYNF